MTLTEAAACATPAVVTDIVGHRDAVADGRSGLVVPEGGLGIGDRRRAERRGPADPPGRRRPRRAAGFTWDAAAVETFRLLAEEAHRRRS